MAQCYIHYYYFVTARDQLLLILAVFAGIPIKQMDLPDSIAYVKATVVRGTDLGSPFPLLLNSRILTEHFAAHRVHLPSSVEAV